jgi:hypothetical protein
LGAYESGKRSAIRPGRDGKLRWLYAPISTEGLEEMSSKRPAQRKPARKTTRNRTAPEARPTQLLKESALPNFHRDHPLLRAFIYCRELKAAENAARAPASRPRLAPRLVITLTAAIILGFLLPAATIANVREQVLTVFLSRLASGKQRSPDAVLAVPASPSARSSKHLVQ